MKTEKSSNTTRNGLSATTRSASNVRNNVKNAAASLAVIVNMGHMDMYNELVSRLIDEYQGKDLDYIMSIGNEVAAHAVKRDRAQREIEIINYQLKNANSKSNLIAQKNAQQRIVDDEQNRIYAIIEKI